MTDKFTVRLDNSEGRFIPSGYRVRNAYVMVRMVYPRPWWRRMLHLRARSRRFGPFPIEHRKDLAPPA